MLCDTAHATTTTTTKLASVEASSCGPNFARNLERCDHGPVAVLANHRAVAGSLTVDKSSDAVRRTARSAGTNQRAIQSRAVRPLVQTTSKRSQGDNSQVLPLHPSVPMCDLTEVVVSEESSGWYADSSPLVRRVVAREVAPKAASATMAVLGRVLPLVGLGLGHLKRIRRFDGERLQVLVADRPTYDEALARGAS